MTNLPLSIDILRATAVIESAWLLATLFAAASAWYFVKRVCIVFDKPEWWDYSDLVSGAVAFVPTFAVYSSASLPTPNPIIEALLRAGVLAVGVSLCSWFSGMLIQECTDWIPQPDRLAEPAKRIRGQQLTEENTDG